MPIIDLDNPLKMQMKLLTLSHSMFSRSGRPNVEWLVRSSQRRPSCKGMTKIRSDDRSRFGILLVVWHCCQSYLSLASFTL